MIPNFDVATSLETDGTALRALRAYEVVHGFSAVRDYRPLIDIEWTDVEGCVEAEDRWMELASAAEDPARFDEILAEAPDVEADGDFDWLFRYTDVGVAGLVFALSAAGYATCYSCRGHAGIAGTQVPQVRLGTEPDRLRLLAEYAAKTGCGALVDSDGLVTVFAPSARELHLLAGLILSERATFEALDSPPWQQMALDALEAGDEFEWDESEVD
jgi:hypothetical protein